MFKSQIQFPKAGLVAHLDALSLAIRYGYPVPGKHPVNVAIISLGGGYAWADIVGYCTRFNLPRPVVKDYGVGDGATNDYTGDPNSADLENALDIQNIIGSTRGKVGVRIYIARNTLSGFAAAVQAVADMNTCVACSISWGSPEFWLIGDVEMDKALLNCKNLNIPVFCASGDGGSSDGLRGNNCDYPSCSPYAVGAGGTTLTTPDEQAWFYGGGGVSKLYAKPDWQSVPGTQRQDPDLSLNADANSGYPVLLNGRWYTVGGTSAVGPMLAGGVACVASNTTQRIKNFVETIYKTKLLTDITQGNNGAFSAGPGYDNCTGLGTPNAAFWAQFKKL